MSDKKKLLIVDDAPFIREIVKHIVAKDEAIEVIGEAENGVNAVTKANSLKPDIILMDIVMPQKSGIQATEEILAENPNIKIISCSTLDKDLLADKAKNAGCIDHVQKPFTAEGLLETLKKALEIDSEPLAVNS